MMKKRLAMVLSIIMLVTFSVTGVSAQSVQPRQSLVHKPGMLAYEHLQVLAGDIGARVAGSTKEVEARDYIAGEFERLGFKTAIQEFSYTRRGVHYDSANVVAVKPGRSTKVVILGAHYDSVTQGKGADDNASSVAVMLEVAEVLRRVSVPYTIHFVAFGAEEVGLQGSNYYASEMTPAEIKNTVAMINLDSLIAGDKMYVHGGIMTEYSGQTYLTEADGWVRDQALQIIKRKKLDIGIQPGMDLDGLFPAGTTGPWSDHAPFARLGIPYAYFESTNWDIEAMDGYTQTEEYGEIWHTTKDTIETIGELFPGRIMERLSSYSEVLSDLLKLLNNPGIAKKAA